MALASVLAVLLAVNLLTNRLAPGLYLPTCIIAAAVLLLIARHAGPSWAELGMGRANLRSGLRWALTASATVLTTERRLPTRADAVGADGRPADRAVR